MGINLILVLSRAQKGTAQEGGDTIKCGAHQSWQRGGCRSEVPQSGRDFLENLCSGKNSMGRAGSIPSEHPTGGTHRLSPY